jgi:hypothetical protein
MTVGPDPCETVLRGGEGERSLAIYQYRTYGVVVELVLTGRAYDRRDAEDAETAAEKTKKIGVVARATRP